MAIEQATFAGGCFWCMVKPFEETEGIIKVVSGYAGGHVVNPTYQEVCSGKTGHTEAVQITFDSDKISYEDLLKIYWRQTDPTDEFGQFADRGTNYRPVIFYHNREQRRLAEGSKAMLELSGRFDKPIVTSIEAYSNFYPAEEGHQGFYRTNPEHYQAYRLSSGRQSFIDQNW
ncbi:peptide-methionine (S)-S-oxide reductase [Atopobacter sp. AH10]|uniref:peptide-methionine (S)-S-oxide reductase MsrA n=1 Tax=Atopobacter sp. AH10 TaxID=2315861 RepID=UPI000EF229E3|nr:peptide-methionine (S)-S-oxide reductase MsrA [Atopobacter sp. AH10]RLK62649.1 peptide-methionine (S)-S-oxide reductase [Atopobacter sp. AH10]